jgi:ABC-type ATPase involved in cell division
MHTCNNNNNNNNIAFCPKQVGVYYIVYIRFRLLKTDYVAKNIAKMLIHVVEKKNDLSQRNDGMSFC